MKQKLIVGLGNSGQQYTNTRHNAGFFVVDYLCKAIDSRLAWSMHKKSNAEICTLSVDDYDIVCAKPQTMMNNSGASVLSLAKWFAIPKISDILIIHDDLDITLGSFKLQQAKSPKQHNGVSSVEDCLNSRDFFRLRIGIENRGEAQISGHDYVLQPFKKTELESITTVCEELVDVVTSWVKR